MSERTGWTAFTEAERAAVYRAIRERRDVRHFRPAPVPDEVLRRCLEAAHRAPSVGFMQPWTWVVVRDRAVRERVHAAFRRANAEAAEVWEGDRRALYDGLKLQGILDAPLGLAVFCDRERAGPQVLGRHSQPDTDLYSTALSIQNFWLAARAEGLGVGWVSIVDPDEVRRILGAPEHAVLVAWLAVGWPVELPAEPMLQRVGWRRRLALAEVVREDAWDGPAPAAVRGVDPAAFDAPPADPGASPTAGEAPASEPEAPAAPPPAGPDAEAAARRRLERLTRPPGSLGRLDAVALQVARIQGRPQPRTDRRHLLLLAGDHGVVAEGVSAWRPEVTARMVLQFVAGAGAVNAFARKEGVRVHVADLGVDHDFSGATGVVDAKVRRGTRNLAREAAMTPEEAETAVAAGRRLLRELGPVDLLAVGEMGIGNTTAAAALAAALLGLAPEEAVGAGAGVGPRTRAHKAEVVGRALALHAEALRDGDPRTALARLGGFEIAGLVGVILEAARRPVAVVLDGFITGVAALVAARLDPAARDHLVAGHRSAEPAHAAVLDALGLAPLLDLEMRLGEGSGAVLALGLVDAACRTLSEMQTFEEAGIAHPEVPEARR